MKLAIDSTQTRLAISDGKTLTFYEIDGDVAKKLLSIDAPQGRHVASCPAYVAVLSGKLSAAGASVTKATVLRFRWDGSALPPISVGEVDRRGLSFTADGTRCVVTDWRSCRVTLFDDSAQKLGAAGRSIPSGASISPDGTRIICGTADQGSGAILTFDPKQITEGVLAMRTLKPPKPSPGLDDAPYFSTWSRDGSLVAISNHSWGGRGVFIYDGNSLEPLWSLKLAVEEEDEDEEPDHWFPQPLAFSSDGKVLFVAQSGAIALHDAHSGANLGTVKAPNGDGSAGFAVQDAAKLLWLPGAAPRSVSFASVMKAVMNPEAKSRTKPATKKPK